MYRAQRRSPDRCGVSSAASRKPGGGAGNTPRTPGAVARSKDCGDRRPSPSLRSPHPRSTTTLSNGLPYDQVWRSGRSPGATAHTSVGAVLHELAKVSAQARHRGAGPASWVGGLGVTGVPRPLPEPVTSWWFGEGPAAGQMRALPEPPSNKRQRLISMLERSRSSMRWGFKTRAERELFRRGARGRTGPRRCVHSGRPGAPVTR